jgi:hypothetical protein
MPIGVVSDRNYISVYDLRTSAFRVLVTKDNTEWFQGSAKFYIWALEGATALISESGSPRNSASPAVGNIYLLDTNTAGLTLVPLAEELAATGRKLRNLYLVNTDGVLVLTTMATSDTILPRGPLAPLWVRYPSGQYVQLSVAGNYDALRLTDREIFYDFGGSRAKPDMAPRRGGRLAWGPERLGRFRISRNELSDRSVVSHSACTARTIQYL